MPERRHGVTTLTENATRRLQEVLAAQDNPVERAYTLAQRIGPATSYMAAGLTGHAP